MPANAETLTLSSTYSVAGTNPDGSKYTGTAAVKVVSDATFTIKWTVGSSVYTGFGMRMNDALAATYMIDGEPGLVDGRRRADAYGPAHDVGFDQRGVPGSRS